MLRTLPVLLCVVFLSGCATKWERQRKEESGEVSIVLDSLHDAASQADGQRYFNLFAPEAVFLGTDASERWSLAQFKRYAEPLFSAGHGWSYTSTQRYIRVEPTGWAMFDELLTNAKYGTCRGSGSLRKTEHGWKITQYDLSVPIPNDLLPDFAGRIHDYELRNPDGTSKP